MLKSLLSYVCCRIQGTSSKSCHISTHSHIKLLHFPRMKASVIWKRPRHSVLARFSSLKTYLQVWIDLKYGLSPPHVSYQPGATSAVEKERGKNDNCGYGTNRLEKQRTLFAAPGPEHRVVVCGQGLLGSECLKCNARKSSHMWGEGGTPHPPTESQAPSHGCMYSHGHHPQQFQDALPIPLLG